MKKILSLTVEVDYPKNEDFKEFEKEVRSKVLAAGQALIRQAGEIYEKQRLETKGYRIKEKASRWIDTTVGSTEINRYKVVDHNPKKGEPRVKYLVDRWMGVGRYQRETELLREEIIDQTVQRSFRKSSQEIKKLSTVKMKPMKVWNITQREAKKQKEQKREIYRLPCLPLPNPIHQDQCPILCIEPDATYCHNRYKKWKNHEVKAAILYTGKKKVGRKRYKLENKSVVVSRKGDSVERFISRVAYVAVARYQAHSKTMVIIKGDGDPWILRLKYDHFPYATFYLDPYHVFKKLELALGSREAAENLKHYVYEQNPRGLLKEIEKLYHQLAEEKDKQKLEDFYNYIEINIEGLGRDTEENLLYKKRWPTLFKRGSGGIERNIAGTVNDRCKLPRMSWSENGLDNILCLREHWLNKKWQTSIKRFVKIKNESYLVDSCPHI